MSVLFAEYNQCCNCIDIVFSNGNLLWLSCEKVEDKLITTPYSLLQVSILAIDNPIEYVRMALDFEMQAWINAIDTLI